MQLQMQSSMHASAASGGTCCLFLLQAVIVSFLFQTTTENHGIIAQLCSAAKIARSMFSLSLRAMTLNRNGIIQSRHDDAAFLL